MTTPVNQSILKAFAMLRAFNDRDEWLTSAELSRRSGLPEASGYRLIRTLVDIGAVVRGPRGKYRLGLLLASLSQNVAKNELLKDTSKAVLKALAEQVELIVHFGVLEDAMVTYIAKVGNHSSFAVHTREGTQLDPYCTALGKVLLSTLPPQDLDAIVPGKLVPLTPNTIASPAELRRELERVRVQGYAVDDQEHSLGLRCISVPLRDAWGRTVAAISASGAAAQIPKEREAHIRNSLQMAAAEIQRMIFPEPYLEPGLQPS